MSSFSHFDLENFGKMAAQAYLDGGVNLNDTITKMAQENQFTSHHIERVVQNANILVNGALVNQAREKNQDPRVTFPLANAAMIGDQIHEPAVQKQAAYRETRVRELYTVPAPAIDRGQLLDGVLGKMATAPYTQTSVDHLQLAGDFILKKEAGVVDAASLSLACQTLADLEHRALTDHNVTKLAMDEAENDLRSEINDQLLSGLAPATVRDVVKHARLSPLTADYVNNLVTKVATHLRLREGVSAFAANTTLVNIEHPLVTKAASVDQLVAAGVRTRRGLDKLADANRRAHAAYARALHGAR